MWHADVRGLPVRLATAAAGLQVRQCLVWVKPALVLGRQDYQWRHEPCLYGWADEAAHMWLGDRAQTTVLEFDKPARNGEHPTMKPVALFQALVANSCPKGGAVLDPFGGSGTTLVAAEQAGRAARLLELDPKYCDVSLARAAATFGDAVGIRLVEGAAEVPYADVVCRRRAEPAAAWPTRARRRMRLGARVARVTADVTAAAAVMAGCPGRGVVNRLATRDDPDPPPYPGCAGLDHVLVIDEVVVEAGEPAGAPPGP